MFIKNYKDFLFEVRDKKHEPAGEKAEKDHKDGNHAGKDEELEKQIDDELTDIAEDCPRCGEHVGSCECAEKDPWSTQVYHRVSKGKEIKPKPKQEFKK